VCTAQPFEVLSEAQSHRIGIDQEPGSHS